MPIIYQKFIYREDLKANPDALYLFGDNTLRRGLGGQAKEMRGEPNAVGVATKETPTSGTNAYFTDEKYEANCAIFDADLEPAFAAVMSGKIVVIPLDGLGTGLSELPQRAPRTNEALLERLAALKMLADVWEPQKVVFD